MTKSKTIPVAIQGERGSFSEEAAIRLLGKNVEVHCCEHFEDVFRAAEKRRVRYCVIPIENSLAGSIYKSYDLLLRYHLQIVREVNVRIRHNLIALPGVSFQQIRTVMSHPVALDQCEKFFERYPRLIRQSAYDTSGSLKKIVEQQWRDCAAIAGERAAKYYGGEILMAGIEDNRENFTRFFLLSSEPEVLTNADKMSIVFSFSNAPGALFKSLSVFALREIDLTKIESRPIHGRPWEYLFYIDFLGKMEDPKIQNALNHLREFTEFLEVLGCYPRDSRQRKKRM
ncbi:MAG: prephenate dehydratase [Acidobacteria bacterium]|nr:prephenate dehydratase [Acidobacteriota bacterium]